MVLASGPGLMFLRGGGSPIGGSLHSWSPIGQTQRRARELHGETPKPIYTCLGFSEPSSGVCSKWKDLVVQ